MLKKYFTMIFIIAFLCGANLIAQQNEQPPKPTDQGLTSEVHKLHAGEIVFANQKVAFQNEKPETFKNSFKWGDPIYMRVFLKQGLAPEYYDMGWNYSYATYYYLELKANGKPVAFQTRKTNMEWTTFQGCFYPIRGDNFDWRETGLLWDALGKLKGGDNNIEINIYPRQGTSGPIGKIISSGVFTLNVDQKDIDKANRFVFTRIKTRWTNEDAWKEWQLYLEDKSGSLKTRFSGDDSWNAWEYNISGTSGSIKTRFSSDDSWDSWEMNSSQGTITMRTRFSKTWNSWEIKGKSTLKVKTRWSSDDGWKEWDISGPKGTMKVKTRWTSDDGWKEWEITDNMPEEDKEMKLAAIFPCLYCAIFFR